MPDEMTHTERLRVGKVVAARMTELELSAAELARRARVDPTTVRALVNGARWPNPSTRQKLAAALGWDLGDTFRVAAMHGYLDLSTVSTKELLVELCRRFDACPGHCVPGVARPETPDSGNNAPAP